MKFIKLDGAIFNSSLIDATHKSGNNIIFELSHGGRKLIIEEYNTEQEAQARFDEIQKLLGVE